MGIQFSSGHGVDINLTLSLTDSQICLTQFASQKTFALLVYHTIFILFKLQNVQPPSSSSTDHFASLTKYIK